jgi:phage gpG-like protein
MMTVSTQGREEVIKNIDMYDKRTQQQIQNIINSTANTIRNNAIDGIKNSPASGVSYNRGKTKHTASSAGNPPRTDTGRLVSSIKMLVNRLEAIVGTDLKYGAYLEFGTRRNLEPRPWLFPVFERERRNFLSRIKDALK